MPRLPFLRGACWLWILAVVSLSSGRADAYAWMIKHGFSKCGSCHTDPSGGETLTKMGRIESEYLLSAGGNSFDVPSKSAQFLWGAIEEADNVRLGGSYRPIRDIRLSAHSGIRRAAWGRTARNRRAFRR